MRKRLPDADSRRFFDDFGCVKASRLRGLDVITPAMTHALIDFPSGKKRLIRLTHNRFPSGGGWSFFRCPGCDRRAGKLYEIDDMPRCAECGLAMNVKYRSRDGFGVAERHAAQDKHLDRLLAKVNSPERITIKPKPPSWGGKCQLMNGWQHLNEVAQRKLITLRLRELASVNPAEAYYTRPKRPSADTQTLDIVIPWKAKSNERLEQALDNAHDIITTALESDDHAKRDAAVRIMLKSRQAREAGW